MRRPVVATVIAAALLALGCVPPDEQRPGLWLPGEVAVSLPLDWAFTDDFWEIAVQVRTPYGLAHSVTVWCAAEDGSLYLGARDPESKRWPGWVERDPDVRLGVGGMLYDVRLARVDDPDALARIRNVYARKYDVPSPPPPDAPPVRYWVALPRS